MSKKLKSRPSVPVDNTVADREADLAAWVDAGARLRKEHPRAFAQLLSLGQCVVREFTAGAAFEAVVAVEAIGGAA